MRLSKKQFQVILLDRNNFHQFQPLFYQVATAGLEPSSISFPFRKLFQGIPNFHFRLTDVLSVDAEAKNLETSIGTIEYDYLVCAMGATTNYFGLKDLEQNALPMKSVAEALGLRNTILSNYEKALAIDDEKLQQAYMNIVVVGGGPTGVELAGAISEMKKNILPKDYPELDFEKMQVYLVEAYDNTLSAMSANSQLNSERYLKKLDTIVLLKTAIQAYDGNEVKLSNGELIQSKSLIWAAGIRANKLKGIPDQTYHRNGRIKVDQLNRVPDCPGVFALGDQCISIEDSNFPDGHPQVAQVAIQQAKNLAKNLNKTKENSFSYTDKGSMATIGRNLAVADLPSLKLKGFIAWLLWMFVHLFSIAGAKNKLLIFINWAWNYLTYDQSLRLLIRAEKKSK